MIEWLLHLPPRARIRAPDLNPETGRQRIDPETGELLWTREELNVLAYASGALYTVLYMLVVLLWEQLRSELSPAYRREKDRELSEFLEQGGVPRSRSSETDDL